MSGTLRWGASQYLPWENFGWWTAAVRVNQSQKDFKSQNYQPHGSLPTEIAPYGALVQIDVVQTYFIWSVSVAWYPELAGFRSDTGASQ